MCIRDRYNTYVGTLACTLWALAQPGQEGLVAELREEYRLAASSDAKALDWKGFESLDLHTKTFNEALRLYGPAPCIARRVSPNPIELGNFHIPVGTEVMIPFVHIHSDQDTWGGDAERFDPRTHFETPPKRGEWMPFSDGQRSCPGGGYARAAFVTALGKLLSHFDWKPAEGYEFGLGFNGFGFGPVDKATGKKQVNLHCTPRNKH
eukprot:TRINITY_DN14646_c0_g2_i1.p1 TRINITY_DN14646_c0_g2~~TRINITY_DN14646_c0_g2_i1.p1  ORF type:complete len:207 (+),score=32.95 TRINITY_DN14646_c0_g2_i1:183-803(+)